MSERRSIGTLFIVATPIGNLDDITLRAVDVLRSVGIVAAEDTRRSAVLLAHIGARPRKLLSLHDHNEAERSKQLITLLQQGHSVALVSDAGTPLISDPGFDLIRRVRAEGIDVVPIPGASALTAVLSVSPLPIERFMFEGFLPSRDGARRKRLEELTRAPIAVVFFEAARRMRSTLDDLRDIAGASRELLIAKELTKVHERIEVGAIGALVERLQQDAMFERGEFVCVLGPPSAEATSDAAQVDVLLTALCAELSPAQAAKIAARVTGRSRAELYDEAMKRKRS